MRVLQRAILAAITLAATPLAAQDAGTRVKMDVAGGMMRYGPHAMVGLELATPRFPLAARLDAVVGVAPDHDVPGQRFTAVMLGAVLPFNANGRVSPYLLGGATLSASRHLDPAIGGAAGVGARLRVGKLSPFVEARAQNRAGPVVSLGLRF